MVGLSGGRGVMCLFIRPLAFVGLCGAGPWVGTVGWGGVVGPGGWVDWLWWILGCCGLAWCCLP